MEVKYRLRLILLMILTLFLSGVLSILIYVTLHEAGHSIVALACGGRITRFSVLYAHMKFNGGNFNNLTAMLLNVNGALLPVLLSYLYMALYRADSKSRIYHIVSFFLTVMTTFSLIPWVLFPIISRGETILPANDDIARFLDLFITTHNALWVTGAALLLMGISVALIVRRGILRNFVKAIKEMRSEILEVDVCA